MAKNQFHEFDFPLKGISDYFSFEKQFSMTCPNAINVRGHDPRTGRYRGAQRKGIVKYVDDRSSANPIQNINHIVGGAGFTGPTSLTTRSIIGVMVTNGVFNKFDSSTIDAIAGSTLDSNAPVIFSTLHFLNLYYCDGTNYVLTDGSTSSTWTASAGTLPVDSGNAGRLITTWRNRIVISGISSDPQNWFMSAVNDPLDWDYAPDPTVQTQAVAGNNSNASKCPDNINCLIAYNDDLLIFGCDHSIYQMTGDPMAGGQIDLISDSTGMAWGKPYCRSPEGVIYFFGSRGGVFRMSPGNIPEQITSKNIGNRLSDVNLVSNIIRMAWSEEDEGFYLYVTPLDGSETINYFYDAREDAWWSDIFKTALNNPVSVHVFDGDSPSDRVVLLGCQDGYLRNYNPESFSDDGDAIESSVWIGPLRLDQDIAFVAKELQMKLGYGSDSVFYEVHSGKSAEDAFYNGQVRIEGKWHDGRNVADRQRSSGHACYLRIGNNCVDETWSVEEIMIGLTKLGSARQRASGL